MRYANLMKNDTVDTESGFVVSVWLQGCPFRCKGCHNPDTWDYEGGIEIDETVLINRVVESINEYGIKRDLSILGGEPLCDTNLPFTNKLISIIKKQFPDIKIYVWTGYTYKQLLQNKCFDYILSTVDILITGPYIESQRDITLKLRGSTNQEIWRRNKDGILILDI